MPLKGIYAKFLTALGLVVIFILIGMGTVVHFQATTILKREIEERLVERSRGKAVWLKKELEHTFDFLSELSQNSLLVNSLIDAEGRARYLPIFMRDVEIPDMKGALISLTDFRGKVMASNGHEARDYDGEEWVSTVMEGRPYAGVIPWGNGDALLLALPVYYLALPEGILVAEIGLNFLESLVFEEVGFRKSLLMQANGVDLIGDPAPFLEVKPEVSKWVAEPSRLRSSGNLLVLASSFQNKELGLDWILIEGIEQETIFQPLGMLKNRMLFVGLLMAAGGAVLVVFLARGLTSPIRVMDSVIRSITEVGDLAKRVPVRSDDEVGQLGRSFNQMLEKLRNAHEALRESETRYRGLVEGSIEGVCIHQDSIIRFANAALAEILGYESPQELIGQDYRALVASHEQARLGGYRAARLRGEPVPSRYEFQGARKDGRPIWLECLASPVSWDGKRAILATFFDITERKQAGEELQRQREAYAQSEKLAAMGSLLAGVAHELNNPLAVVLGHLAVVRRTAADGPLAQRVEKIAQAAQRCGRIVKNFLALARQQPAERQRVQLNQVVEEAVELLAYQLRVDNVEVTLNLVTDLPVLWADPHQLHQVVVNLILNAHQAMRQSPSPWQLTLTTRFDPVQGRVSLEVADTGPGILPEIRSRIFEPFFTTKPQGQGTGLGLSLCQGLVESHAGSIRVENQPGRGAVFSVELPVVAPPVVEPGAGPAEAPPCLQGMRILVVDDETEMAGLLAEMLSADGHQVDTATDGAMALDRLRERAYEVIVSDIRMPKLDGPGLYRELERRHPGLRQRLIFITGDGLGPETRGFLEATGIPRLGKPFDQEDLQRAIEQVLQPSEQA